jgi:hypothetical protein
MRNQTILRDLEFALALHSNLTPRAAVLAACRIHRGSSKAVFRRARHQSLSDTFPQKSVLVPRQ